MKFPINFIFLKYDETKHKSYHDLNKKIRHLAVWTVKNIKINQPSPLKKRIGKGWDKSN